MESSYNKSTRDALTGLYNRVYFHTTVSFLVNDNKPISVIFFDLDNFKEMNDTRDHEEGDVDDPDVDVGDFAERIRARIEEEIIVTASLGYATLEEGDSTDLVIKRADKAMYVAKKTGKNRVLGFANLTEEQLALLIS